MVANLTDDDIWQLNRGGHDPSKIYAAYPAAVKHAGQPTVILAKTVKGYGMGEAGEGKNFTHQQKKLGDEARAEVPGPLPHPDLRTRRSRRRPSTSRAEDSPEIQYMHERRKALGGYLPARRSAAPKLEIPELSIFDSLLKGSGDRDMSTTMAFVRMLAALTRDKELGKYVVPIVAGRVAHVRHGGPVPAGRHLLLAGPALRARGLATRSPTTARIGAARSCRRESTRRARCRRGSRRGRRTRTTACRCCPSTSSTRCSASSAWAT